MLCGKKERERERESECNLIHVLKLPNIINITPDKLKNQLVAMVTLY